MSHHVNPIVHTKCTKEDKPTRLKLKILNNNYIKDLIFGYFIFLLNHETKKKQKINKRF